MKDSRGCLFFSRSGQSQILAVAMLGIAVASFSWIASASLLRRTETALSATRKLEIANLNIKLAQAARAPAFFNEQIIAANPKFKEALEQMNADDLNIKNVMIPEFVIHSPSGEPWFGGGGLHQKISFEACVGAGCAYRSEVTAHLEHQGGVGYLNLLVKFYTVGRNVPPLNPELPANQLSLSIPANLWGVTLIDSRLMCQTKFKSLLLTQNPGGLLCIPE